MQPQARLRCARTMNPASTSQSSAFDDCTSRRTTILHQLFVSQHPTGHPQHQSPQHLPVRLAQTFRRRILPPPGCRSACALHRETFSLELHILSTSDILRVRGRQRRHSRAWGSCDKAKHWLRKSLHARLEQTLSRCVLRICVNVQVLGPAWINETQGQAIILYSTVAKQR